MKILIVFLLCTLQGNLDSDCRAFYEKELSPLFIKGKVVEKKMKDRLYVITIKQDNGEVLSFNLISNVIGGKVYAFIAKDSFIMKKKGTCSLHILSPRDNGGLTGRIFDKLCDD